MNLLNEVFRSKMDSQIEPNHDDHKQTEQRISYYRSSFLHIKVNLNNPEQNESEQQQEEWNRSISEVDFLINVVLARTLNPLSSSISAGDRSVRPYSTSTFFSARMIACPSLSLLRCWLDQNTSRKSSWGQLCRYRVAKWIFRSMGTDRWDQVKYLLHHNL